MKPDPVVNNNDELFIANMAQMNKIKYLENQKSKRQSYIKDLQETLSANKQSLSHLASDKKDLALKKLNQENIILHTKLKKYYQDIMNVNASVLIEQQLRIEEKKFYSERILDFENSMTELRKYLQDKEESFSSVVSRLKKYQDLTEVTLETKLHKLSNELNQEYAGALLKKLAEQRDRYRAIWQKINVNIEDLIFLKDCLSNKTPYESMQAIYAKCKEKEGKQDKGISFYQKTKNTTNASNISSKHNERQKSPSSIKNPHRELIKLLKKQKLNNQILQQALNQAIEKNEQLILENNTLVQANIALQIRVEKAESKGYLLEKELTNYDSSLAWKQQWKSKCDADRQKRIKEFEQKGEQNQICMVAMQEDMQKLSSFLMTCIPKGKMVKSSSNPNFARANEDAIEEGEDIQIEEL